MLIRVEDLAVLLANQVPPQTPEATDASQANMAGLAEAVALVAAKVHGVDGFGPSGDVSPPVVTASLVGLATVFLSYLLPRDKGAGLLTDLGAMAVKDTEP